MKSINDIVNIIKLKIIDVATQYSQEVGKAFVCEILPERDFIEKTENDRDPYEEDTIFEVVDKDKIYFVVKFGRGEYNFALSSIPMSIEVVSEENSMSGAQEILRRFVSSVNYIYENGIIQTYFLPSVISPVNQIRSGYRALIELQGKVYDFENLTSAITKVEMGDSSSSLSNIPFINIKYNWSAQPNPQAFADSNGATKNLNRQYTRTIVLTTYLWNDASYGNPNPQEVAEKDFSEKIKTSTSTDMNKRYYIKLSSNSGSSFVEGYFILVSFNYDQNYGMPNVGTMTFTEAEEPQNANQ